MNCNVVEKQDELTYNVNYLCFIDEYKYAEVTSHNTGKDNIECLLYFLLFLKGPNQLKKNKGAKITVCNIASIFLISESMISQ